MEIDYNEVFGVTPETGAEEQEAAAPAEEGAEEQEVAAPAVDESGEAPQEAQEEPPQKTEEDARYAAARRKAEQERDQAIAQARQEAQAQAQRTIDEAFRNAGLTNPYTNQPITSKAEYDAYLERFQAEQRENIQKKSGMSQVQFSQFLNSLPEIRQAREAQAKAEQATRQAREQAAKANLEQQMKEISKMDPTIKGLGDLAKMANYQQFVDLVKRGNTFTDAYKLSNFDALTQRAAQASRQTAMQAAASKEHLTATTQRGQGAVTVPDEVKAEYRAFNPDATDEEIARHYNKYVSR